MSEHIALSKLNERVSQHDVEFAEIRGAVKSISDAATETKESVKAIYSALARTNELIHTSQIKDERFLVHIDETSKKFDSVIRTFDDKHDSLKKRVSVLESGRTKIFLSVVVAFALGFGGMVADYYFKKPSDAPLVVEDTDE